jgi:hypothetical protein
MYLAVSNHAGVWQDTVERSRIFAHSGLLTGATQARGRELDPQLNP